MSTNTGSIRKVVINGATYNAMSDANVTSIPSKYAIEAIPTSGGNMFKMTRRAKTKESVDLGVSQAELQALTAVSESLADCTMAIEFADGSIDRASGRIHIENYESETGKLSLTMIPKNDWTPFIA